MLHHTRYMVGKRKREKTVKQKVCRDETKTWK